MQQSAIYKLIKDFPYPWIVRHNRLEVYADHPEMDYTVLWRYSVRWAVIGFIVGKFLKRPWSLALIAPLPLISNFLYEQWKLKNEGKYQELYRYQDWQVKKKISEIKEKTKQSKQIKHKTTQLEAGISLKQNYFGQKIISTKQFVKRLPKEYF